MKISDFIYGKHYRELDGERYKKAFRKGYWEGALLICGFALFLVMMAFTLSFVLALGV